MTAPAPISFRPEGRSMHPFIRPGDLVTVRPPDGAAAGGIRRGDCVVFRDRDSRWLVHRVIGGPDGSGRFRTKGDALPGPDHAVERNSVAGVVTIVERRGSDRRYRLDRKRNRRLGRLIAVLSEFEAAVVSAFPVRRFSGGGKIFDRLVKSPRWTLTRIFFP